MSLIKAPHCHIDFLKKIVLSKQAWKLDLTSGLNTTDMIGFNHAVDTIKISE